jgi:hypothetical protein
LDLLLTEPWTLERIKIKPLQDVDGKMAGIIIRSFFLTKEISATKI